MENHPQEKYMQEAIKEAVASASFGQYALGAVVVNSDGEVVAVAHTTLHENSDPTCHAEINAIRVACEAVGSRYLPECWLYTTLEPCPMCTSAAIWAKMQGIVFGATKKEAQAFAEKCNDRKFSWRQIDISSKDIIEKGVPRLDLVEGFMREECNKLFELSMGNE